MTQPTKRPHYNVTFSVLLAGIAAFGLLQSLVAPVLPTLIQALHTSQDTATWLITGYLLSASVATPVLGRVGDKAGKKRMLVVSLLALATGSALAGLAHSVGLMIAARVIQGLGGGVLPLSFGIIRDEFPAAKVRGAVGIATAVITVGGGAGLLAAGPIVGHLDYHWLFWIPMIMTALAVAATAVFVPESPVRHPGRINWGAAALLSMWLVALLLAVSEGPAWGWASARVVALFAGAVAGVLLWAAAELRSREALIDMRMMRVPAVWTANLSALLFGVGMFTTLTFLPQLVQTPRALAGYGLSATITQSGVYMLPLTVGGFAFGIMAGPLSARAGSKMVLLAGCAVSMPAFALLALGHDQSWQIYAGTSLMGVGIGLAFSAMSAIVVEAVPPAQTGVASGMNANIRTIGGAIGSSVAASILASGVTAAHPIPHDAGYTHTFWFLAGSALLATAAALLVPARHRSQDQTRTPTGPESAVTSEESTTA